MYLNPSVPSPVILSCSYLQLPSLTRTNISCSLIIQRSSSPLGSPNLEVDKQKNRLITSCAMKKSKVFADQEKYKESVYIIEEAILKISSSLSATDPFCINLIGDLNSLKSRLTETGYTSGGRQLLLTHTQSHVQQRSTNLHSTIYSTPIQERSQTFARIYRQQSPVRYASTNP